MLQMSTHARWLPLLPARLSLAGVLCLCSLPGVTRGDASTDDESPLAHSAMPSQERELRQRLQRVSVGIAAGDTDESIELLRDVLENGGLTFVDVSWLEPGSGHTMERFAGAQRTAERLLLRLSPDSQRRYRQLVEPLATAALETAVRLTDVSRLREVIVRFPQTRAGLRALQTLATRFLDRGEWRAAEVAYIRIVRHSLLPTGQREAALGRIRIARQHSIAGQRRSPVDSPDHRLSARLFPAPEMPIWNRESESGRKTALVVRDAFVVHDEQSIPLLPRARPVVSGDVVFHRTLSGLTALNIESGQTLWNATLPGSAEAAPLTMNPSLQNLVSRSLSKQLQLDTVQSRFVVDADLLVTAEPLGHGRRPQLAPRGPFGGAAASPAHNGIVARYRKDGSTAWAFAASDLVTLQGTTFFTGPPTIVDDAAIGLVQVAETLHLYALSRDTGKLRWTLPIAEAPRRTVADIDWHAIACPVIEVNGTLVCPTAAGLVLGIDLVTRTRLWAIRFPRADVPPVIDRLPAVTTTPRRHWWLGWREVEYTVPDHSDTLDASDAPLVLAGPDSDALLAIRPSDGSILWRRHVESPLYVAEAASSGMVVVVERHAVTGLNPTTGKTVWRTPISEPVGRGCRVNLQIADGQPVEAHHVIPVRDGGFVGVRLSDGVVQKSARGQHALVGPLEFSHGRFVTQQLTGISAWPVAASSSKVASPAAEPGDDVFERLNSIHAAAREAAAAGQLERAFQLYADVLNLNPSSDVTAPATGPALLVRHDRLVQGELLDLIDAAEVPLQQKLRSQFDLWVQKAASSADPFAVQRFVGRWRGIPWAGELAVRDEARIGLDFARSQLDLLRLVEQQQPQASITAGHRLAEMYEARSYTRDAAALRSRIDADAAASPESSIWPTRTPTVSEQSERQADVGYRTIPVECPPGTLFERLNVNVSDDPRGMRLRFSGDGNSGYWQLSLPRSNSPFRGFPMLAKGWGVGHFLVLRIGAELFGITPFDSSGEPRARILWSRSLAEHQRLSSLQFDPSRPGFSINDLTLLDEFDRPIGRVGPVTAGTLCYQSGGKLICLETANGRRVWERNELPRDNLCTGDGRSIWLIQPDSGEASVIRALDGRQMDSFQLSSVLPFSGEILAAQGNLLTVGVPAEATASLNYRRVAVVDLEQRAVRWSTDPASSTESNDDKDRQDSFFAISSRRLGRLTHNGTLHFIDVPTGETISRNPVQRPSALRTAFCVTDAGSHVIALTETAELSFQQPRSVYRNPPLTGTLLALDSHTGKLLWQRQLDGVRLALDQPRNAPFLVLSYERKRAGADAGFHSILQVLDRRTGVDLRTHRSGETEERFVIEPNAAQNRASIRFARRSIRLDFAPSK